MTLSFLTDACRRALAVTVATTGMMSGGAAFAAESVNPGWLVTINGKMIATPAFPGSDTYSFIHFPAMSVNSPDTADHWIGRDQNLSLVLFSPDPSVAIGALSHYAPDQDPQSNFSTKDKRWSVEPGLFAEYWASPDTLRIRGEVRFGADGASGMTGSLGADYVQRLGKFVFSVGPRFGMSGVDYTSAQYNGDFSSLGLTGSGVDARSFGAAGLVKFVAGQNWSTSVYANYDRVTFSNSNGSAPKTSVNDDVRVGASIDFTLSPPGR
jgi:outer membrane scaffolding protein for murein synthesis (MipA/OmpV family)